MRFAIPSPPARSFRLGRRITDWPIAYRIALVIVPSAILVTLVAVWFGYRAASSSLADSLHNLPLFEAKLQASTMDDILKQLRHSLSKIAQSDAQDAQSIRERMEFFFLNNADLIHEIGYKAPDKQTFILVRDSDGFVEFTNGENAKNSHSPFQQIDARRLEPGQAKLYPAVFSSDPESPGAEHFSRKAVLRMAMLQPDSSAAVMIGIDLAKLSSRLAVLLAPDSPLRLPSQVDTTQLAFFFDADGWILFEMLQQQNKGERYLPDTARQGYSGDLGRAGFDAAFRPWASHENYWRMVTDALMGRSGSLSAPADKYMSRQLGEDGLLCFAPVVFAAADGIEPKPIGGIAFFETSVLPLHAFLRVANYSIIIMVAAIIIFTLLVWRISRKFAQPLSLMAKRLAAMNTSENLSFINVPPAFVEQQRIQSAVNKIISNAMIDHKELERLSREMRHARSRLPVALGQAFGPPRPQAKLGLVGSSPQMEAVRQHTLKAAQAGTDVLIWGETGTGKELVAAAIHKAGKRSAGPYISINCGALDENLLLDALFGHVKGAFTEAKDDRKGAFLAANGGTLHLDEIANASAKVQQSLLRALSVRRSRPLGSDTELPFDTRVVAATNVDLRECVRAGSFREDLYYRLAIINIETPPLRYRRRDIPELAAHLIHEAAQSLGRTEARLSQGALDMMAVYDWPGNVRELKNCITRAMAFVEGDIILPEHIVLEQDAYRTYAKSASHKALSRREEGDMSGMVPARTFYPPAEAAAGQSETAMAEAGHDDKGKSAGFIRGIVNAASHFLPSGDRNRNNGGGTFPLPPSSAGGPGAEHPYSTYHYPAAYIFGNPDPFQSHTPVAAGTRPPASPPVPPAEHPLPATADPRMEDLNERQLRAMALVRGKGKFTRSQYQRAAGAGISSRTAQNDLRELVERGILERVGAGPGTRYTLAE